MSLKFLTIALSGCGHIATRARPAALRTSTSTCSIARCIAGNPPIILADEPTASLDAQTGQLVTEVLHNLAKKRGNTVVTVTHDNRIYHFADRIVHIEDGMILDDKKETHP